MSKKVKVLGKRPMTMKEFEGTAEDKKVDRTALKKINKKRKIKS